MRHSGMTAEIPAPPLSKSPGENLIKVLIVTLGSRGDVQPYMALGSALKTCGHTVTLCTCESFKTFITDHGLNYRYMNDDFIKLMKSETGKQAVEDTDGLIGAAGTTLKLFKQIKPILKQTLLDSWEAARTVDPDIMIMGSKGALAEPVAEKLGIPSAMAMPIPQLVPTAEVPAAGFPCLKIGGWYNLLTYRIVKLSMGMYGRMLNEFRQSLLDLDRKPRSVGIFQRADGRPIVRLHCFSRHVVPRPHDWPPDAHVNGYWFLDRLKSWSPPVDLQAFIENGDPPVYIGFGSMAGKNAGRLAASVAEALQQVNMRGVIASGWGGIETRTLPESIYKIDSAPHDWLFPLMSAVVHHGGAGTTAAGLRAGRPSIICPFIGDQPFWGLRINELGAGPEPIPQKKLTAIKLAEALQKVKQNQAMRQNARNLGSKIRQEDGITGAIDIIEKMVNSDRGNSHN